MEREKRKVRGERKGKRRRWKGKGKGKWGKAKGKNEKREEMAKEKKGKAVVESILNLAIEYNQFVSETISKFLTLSLLPLEIPALVCNL